MARRRILITGLVQGVGFRYALQREAQARDIVGWVTNRVDGAVEACLVGEEEAVARLIAWARCGPPGARVDNILVELAEGDFSDFRIRPSLAD